MTQLVIIVVAAVWAAVVIPPLLRSRVENRPNSSVTDFRRQLSTLQSTSTPRMRTIGRPLAQQSSPLHRPAAAGRPGQAHHRQASLHGNSSTSGRQRTPAITGRSGEGHPAAPVYRSHGDPSGGIDRPHRQTHMDRQAHPEHEAGPQHRERADRRHGGPGAAAPRPRRAIDPRANLRRRRSNVLFLLVVLTACTLFLAMVTSATVPLYVFTLLFLATCGYVYQLTQVRRRERSGWNDGWFEQRR